MTPYFAGMNKTTLRAHLRSIVNPQPMSTRFENDLISELILEKHYYCSVHKLRPIAFRKVPRSGKGYDFQGWFENSGWHTVSWDQCIAPNRDVDFICDALRRALRPITTEVVRLRPICEVCEINASEHCHHESPHFSEIVRDACEHTTEEEWVKIWQAFDWWNPEPFAIPSSSSLYGVAIELHSHASLQAVCAPCHSSLHSTS